MKTSILAFALRALARRKARAFALGGGLAFAVALVAAVVFLTESLRAEAERAHAAHPDNVVQRLVGGRPTNDLVITWTPTGAADYAVYRTLNPAVLGSPVRTVAAPPVTFVGECGDGLLVFYDVE